MVAKYTTSCMITQQSPFPTGEGLCHSGCLFHFGSVFSCHTRHPSPESNEFSHGAFRVWLSFAGVKFNKSKSGQGLEVFSAKCWFKVIWYKKLKRGKVILSRNMYQKLNAALDHKVVMVCVSFWVCLNQGLFVKESWNYLMWTIKLSLLFCSLF